jgi:hypothetical protein
LESESAADLGRMEVAGLTISILGLYTSCMQGYRTVATIKGFSKESSSLYWRLRTQELRFLSWGESFGCTAKTNTLGANSHPPWELVTSEPIENIARGILSTIRNALDNSNKLREKYGLDRQNSSLEVSAMDLYR